MKARCSLFALLVVVIGAAAAAPATCTSLEPLREINYYPRQHAWLEFWPNWPDTRAEMDADLDLVRDLGANVVRIFVHPNAIGYPVPGDAFAGYFEDALTLIDDHGLKAHVTLFDCWWSWDDVQASEDWLDAVVGPYSGDPRIAVWELQNEVDLSQQVVRDWIQAVFPHLKGLAGSTPCTISVNDVEWLDDVKALTGATPPDLYSLHWYPSSLLRWTTPLPAAIDRARELIGSAELLLGEFGTNTYHVSEASQAYLYRDVLYHANQKQVVHLGAWTLYDFPEGVAQCTPDPAPDTERYFGLYRLDGTPKPAAAVLKRAFHGDFPQTPVPDVMLNTSFEQINLASGLVDNWQPWDQFWSGEQRFVQDCEVAFRGDCSLRVLATPGTMAGMFYAPGLPVTPGRSYYLEGHVRTADLDGWARIVLAWFDCDENWLAQDVYAETTEPNTANWAPLRIVDAAPPANACYFQVYGQVSVADPLSRVWFDDVTILGHRIYLPLLVRPSVGR
ncbi:MAG: cellulase family glycosylhydrolase [Anaerolineae bacterium]